MRDCRYQIVKALITKINEVLPNLEVYTAAPKPVNNNGVKLEYPYIYISDINQDEDGPKAHFYYSYTLLIQVVHKDEASKVDQWSNVGKVVGLINNGEDLDLDDDFEVMDFTLESNTEQEIQTDTGVLSIGLIRCKMNIEDLG